LIPGRTGAILSRHRRISITCVVCLPRKNRRNRKEGGTTYP
jgi:hypothetical protein